MKDFIGPLQSQCLMADMVIAISLLRREAHLKAASATPGQTLGLPGTSVPGKPSAEMQKVRGKSESVSTNLVSALSSPAGRTVPTDHKFDLLEEKPSHSPEQRQTSQHETPIIVRGEIPRNHHLPGDVSPDSPPAPLSQLGTAGWAEGAEAIGRVLPPSSLPRPLVPVFQGISGGTLDRNVNPIYPPEALALRLEGSVVLSVVIDETGNVRILKTLTGDPTLARAAIDAVRQWHYHPYLLNGQPVKRQAKITLTFKLP
jgi:TonB family protein